jgi:hypothetical protein
MHLKGLEIVSNLEGGFWGSFDTNISFEDPKVVSLEMNRQQTST